jgi:thiol-disulfide isomerase/thioredoxin
MPSRKNKLLLIFFIGLLFNGFSQTVSVYKIEQLLNRLKISDSVYVVNFWATWCKPCVEELPLLEAFQKAHPEIKVLLVTLDFKEELTKKVIPFLKKKNFSSECVLLDETNGQAFIDQIDKRWSGAIPMTLICKKRFSEKQIIEKQLKSGDLEKTVY